MGIRGRFTTNSKNDSSLSVTKSFAVEHQATFGSSKSGNTLFKCDNLVLLTYMTQQNKKVDCIYIDPPYNTKSSDLTFSDSFTSTDESTPKKENSSSLKQSWTVFMRPRLEYAWKLLADDGVFFISIDDREMANAVVMLDSIFGSDHRVATFIKPTSGAKNDAKFWSRKHEYLVIYVKSPATMRWLRKNSSSDSKRSSEKLQPLNKWGSNDRRIDRPNLYFPIFVNKCLDRISTTRKDGWIKVLPKRRDGVDGRWRWSKEKINSEAHRLKAKRQTNGDIKIYSRSTKNAKKIPWSSFLADHNDAGGKDIKQLFGDAKSFSYAKSLRYMKWIISLYAKPDAMILDFFAGSGTTGHAILELNAKDRQKRRFILCENSIQKSSNKAPSGIKDLCLARLAMVISGYTSKDQNQQIIEGAGSGFDFLALESA
jgi:adenine specific DNA methylase Mod